MISPPWPDCSGSRRVQASCGDRRLHLIGGGAFGGAHVPGREGLPPWPLMYLQSLGTSGDGPAGIKGPSGLRDAPGKGSGAVAPSASLKWAPWSMKHEHVFGDPCGILCGLWGQKREAGHEGPSDGLFHVLQAPGAGFCLGGGGPEKAMCFFPLVGVLAGLYFSWYIFLWNGQGAGPVFKGALLTAVPLLATGGIHMDGFLDTCDARASWGDREKKLQILKDTHAGGLCSHRRRAVPALYCGGCSELPVRGRQPCLPDSSCPGL